MAVGTAISDVARSSSVRSSPKTTLISGLLTCRVFKTHKQGESVADCQDAYCVQEGKPRNGDDSGVDWRIAVSDGATSSFFPAEWAKMLSKTFVDSFPNELLGGPGDAQQIALDAWLQSARSSWLQSVVSKAESKPHYTINNGLAERRAGAATLLGVVVNPKIPAKWVAVAVGDSCLFHLGTGERMHSFPLMEPDQFTDYVEALPSRQTDSQRSVNVYRHDGTGPGGCLSEGDVLVMATDALAKFLMERHRAGRSVWSTLLALQDQTEFEAFVKDARQNEDEAMDNDDVTLVILIAGVPHTCWSTVMKSSGKEAPQRRSKSVSSTFTERIPPRRAEALELTTSNPKAAVIEEPSQNPHLEVQETRMTPQEKKHLFGQIRILVISNLILALAALVALTYIILRETGQADRASKRVEDQMRTGPSKEQTPMTQSPAKAAGTPSDVKDDVKDKLDE
jgi:hypothetical protein